MQDIVVHIQMKKRLKLDLKEKEIIFIGYCSECKTYRFFDTEPKKVNICRGASFVVYPFYDEKENVFHLFIAHRRLTAYSFMYVVCFKQLNFWLIPENI